MLGGEKKTFFWGPKGLGKREKPKRNGPNQKIFLVFFQKFVFFFLVNWGGGKAFKESIILGLFPLEKKKFLLLFSGRMIIYKNTPPPRLPNQTPRLPPRPT